MEAEKNLSMLKLDEIGKVKAVNCPRVLRQRLAELGLIKGTTIRMLFQSPSKDPKAYLIRGAVIALRNEDTKYIIIE